MNNEEAAIHGRLDAHREMIIRIRRINNALFWATMMIGGATAGLGIWAFFYHCSH